jgi:hypothetical protein
VENKTVFFQRNGGVSTPNILARKSEEGPPPYCKTAAESEGYNQPGPLESTGDSDNDSGSKDNSRI